MSHPRNSSILAAIAVRWDMLIYTPHPRSLRQEIWSLPSGLDVLAWRGPGSDHGWNWQAAWMCQSRRCPAGRPPIGCVIPPGVTVTDNLDTTFLWHGPSRGGYPLAGLLLRFPAFLGHFGSKHRRCKGVSFQMANTSSNEGKDEVGDWVRGILRRSIGRFAWSVR